MCETEDCSIVPLNGLAQLQRLSRRSLETLVKHRAQGLRFTPKLVSIPSTQIVCPVGTRDPFPHQGAFANKSGNANFQTIFHTGLIGIASWSIA
jgi:hypothetical protein